MYLGSDLTDVPGCKVVGFRKCSSSPKEGYSGICSIYALKSSHKQLISILFRLSRSVLVLLSLALTKLFCHGVSLISFIFFFNAVWFENSSGIK